MSERPSERFCKHGFLLNEPYHPNFHNVGRTIEKRCQDYYTADEIERMRSEIKVAECGICLEEITTTGNCICCSDGHKFHMTCLGQYWLRNPLKNHFCPTTNTIHQSAWQKCDNTNDIHSGGKRKHKKSRKSNKKKKYKKYSNKRRKTQKTRK